MPSISRGPKIGANRKCPCGSGKKFKRCCRDKKVVVDEFHPPPGWTLKQSFDAGTSNPNIARVGLGLIQVVEFVTLPKDFADLLKKRLLETAHLLVKAERIAEPLMEEVQAICRTLEKSGIPQREDGQPYVPGQCLHLGKFADYLKHCGLILDEAFKVFNQLWGTKFNRRDVSSAREFAESAFGEEDLVTKLLSDDVEWLEELNRRIDLAERGEAALEIADFKVEAGGPDNKFVVTLPSFLGEWQVANHIEVYKHNLLTFVEEISVFTLSKRLDPKITIHEIPENLRDEKCAVRFKVGLSPGTDIKSLEGHPQLDKIYRSGQPFYHLKDHLRSGRFGHVREIIHSEYQGKKVVTAGGRIFFGNWKTFTDFLFDLLKMKFGKEWWLAEAAKTNENCHPILDWARKSYAHQKQKAEWKGELYSIEPSGPMLAQLSLAYDLFILEDNQSLQQSLIERMKKPDPRLFGGARYEAKVAAMFIKADFKIEWEDETDSTSRHPEFIAIHRKSGERFAVEAKKRNRNPSELGDGEVKFGVTGLIKDAVSKFKGLPYILFVELDLPVNGQKLMDPARLKELSESQTDAGVRDKDGKDLFNLIFFTNHPVENLEDSNAHPAHGYIVSQTQVPKLPIKNPIHLMQIVGAVERANKIPTWFEQ